VFGDRLGSPPLAASCTRSGARGSDPTGPDDVTSAVACAAVACAAVACAAVTCPAVTCPAVTCPGASGSGAVACGAGDSVGVGSVGRTGVDGDLSSSARRWNSAQAAAVLPYKRLNFRACRCCNPHSRCR
jgi:hypothetical protein